MKKLFFTLCLGGCFLNASSIEINGVISSDLTLEEVNNPHIVTGILSIPEGVTLTIGEGVELYFQHETYVQVAGTIRAVGTAVNPILFSRQDDQVFWGGIVLFDLATDYNAETEEGCKFEYCHFGIVQYVTTVSNYLSTGWAIGSEGTDYYVDHCVAENAQFFAYSCAATIKNSLLHSSGFQALCPELSPSIFTNNEVRNTHSNSSVVSISGGIIANNYFHHNLQNSTILDITQLTSEVTNNVFEENEGVALAILGGQNHIIQENVFQGNDINMLMRCERIMNFTNNCFLSYNDWNIYLDGGFSAYLPFEGCGCENDLNEAEIDLVNNYYSGLNDDQVAASIYDATDDISQQEPFTAVFLPTLQESACITAVGDSDTLSIGMQLYPNPTNDWLHFTNPNDETGYTVTDTGGRIVMQGSLHHRQNRVDVNQLSDGCYLFTLGKGKSQLFIMKRP
ncbi:MAG: T9SS type A sorting domain-containing protein [Flavobacteriales bacterium]